jgi:hypothetical protein
MWWIVQAQELYEGCHGRLPLAARSVVARCRSEILWGAGVRPGRGLIAKRVRGGKGRFARFSAGIP